MRQHVHIPCTHDTHMVCRARVLYQTDSTLSTIVSVKKKHRCAFAFLDMSSFKNGQARITMNNNMQLALVQAQPYGLLMNEKPKHAVYCREPLITNGRNKSSTRILKIKGLFLAKSMCFMGVNSETKRSMCEWD